MSQSSTAGDSKAWQPEFSPRSRVTRACERCRRQKLKCDNVRPCTLCRRSGIQCEPRRDSVISRPQKRRSRAEKTSTARQPERQLQSRQSDSKQPDLTSDGVVSPIASHSSVSQGSPGESQRYGANSSSVGFAAHIFGNKVASHDSIALIPGHGGQQLPFREMTSSRSRLQMYRPPWPVMEALIDVYFNRMHWFIMIVHEASFRETVHRLFHCDYWERSQLGKILASMIAAALGVQCVKHDSSWPGHRLMAENSLDCEILVKALISEIRLHFTDLLEDCSIEAVQIFSLMGTYSIFHGSPTLAWAALGLSVRTAYALALHCDDDKEGSNNVLAQVRHRIWNHIVVADTFGSMIYGRPSAVDPAFSGLLAVQDLDDTVVTPGFGLKSALGSEDPTVSRLTFHVLKSRLYQVTRQAINQFRLLRLLNPISVDDLIALTRTVQELRTLLDAWKADLPAIFDFDRTPEEVILAGLQKRSGEADDENRIRRHLSLQALTLHVTYHTAVIIVHRPLLEYRVSSDIQHTVPNDTSEMIRNSFDICIKAALRLSWVPITEFETEFVLTFILMNFFTSGVVLCIPPTLWPLSSIAHEAKCGTLRFIRAGRRLRDVSHIAAHMEQLLTGLLKTSLQQEVENGLSANVINGTNRKNGGDQTINFAPSYHTADDNNTTHAPVTQQPAHNLNNTGTSIPATADLGILPGSNSQPVTESQGAQAISMPSYDTDVMHSSNPAPNFHDAANIQSNQFSWPPVGWESGHLNQVESQIDEAFGQFGQMLFDLVPNDPYSAWNWGDGVS